MKKLLSIMLIVTLLFPVFPSLETNAIYNTSTAQDYLIENSDNPWSTMALSVLGNSSIPTEHLTFVSGTDAIDYAAPILAIIAIGQNPRTFASIDYVATLKSYHSENQIGDSVLLNDDCFGILALISAGESSDDVIIVDSKNFIFSHQNSDGGWGYSTTAGSDTNMTASAILALISAGVDSADSRIQNALSFLEASQNDDGGFYYNSAFGSDSDSSSTAWVIWALNALSVDPNSLVKSDNTPISYLESNQSDQGFFKYQNSSTEEDSFSAVTTAYTVIALQGKKLPLNIVANDVPEKFSFRIEGSEETVCLGEVEGPTALDIVKNAKSICGFTYEIKDTDWGPYLKRINADEAGGDSGWLYFVNNISPSVGAASYELQSDDSVLWYYGGFDWKPTRLSLSAEQIDANQSVTATVEILSDSLWIPLADASVYFGVDTIVTGDNGQVGISLQDGYYKVYAEKQGYIRSNSTLLKVGQGANSSVDLTVTVGDGDGSDDGKDMISFIIDTDSLDFGELDPGSSASRNITISNNGSSNIHMEALVEGDSLFSENLDLDNVSWKNFETDITQSDSQTVDVELSVPANYSDGSGAKSAQLTFWAVAQ
ncbi:MAG: DUF4430 domain-containing protein [Candidatus Pacebacteria bacterium]|nr:DUF4430 domain-containing protein [Candidatus Paceibacterota bacterium]